MVFAFVPFSSAKTCMKWRWPLSLHLQLSTTSRTLSLEKLATRSFSSRNCCFSTNAIEFPNPPTIFAPATPPGKSAISIVRISGPQVEQVWKSTKSPKSGQASPWPPLARKAFLREIYCPSTNEKLDDGLVLYFPGHYSNLFLVRNIT